MKKQTMTFFAGLIALVLALPAAAENSTLVGGYTVHHNALATDTLTPEIAQAYNIKRSPNRGMISVSVLENRPEGQPRAVPAEIEVVAANLTGQTREIEVRQIREGNAIYYIGDFPVSHEETLNFTLSVKPEGVKQPYTAHFSQQFFTR
jgi:hypothetical protein